MKYYLYIKQSPLGLKYLGKTTKDPIKYVGSGKVWKRHLSKHSFSYEDIKTEVVLETSDPAVLKAKGLELSRKYNIVESNEWANLREESGDGGDTSKHIDYSDKEFHRSSRSSHLNTFKNSKDRELKLKERASKIDYKNPERLRKIAENTDWEAKERKRLESTDYASFLWKTHQKNKKVILQVDLEGQLVREWESAVDACHTLNIKPGTIRSWIANNRTGINSKWLYKKDYETK